MTPAMARAFTNAASIGPFSGSPRAVPSTKDLAKIMQAERVPLDFWASIRCQGPSGDNEPPSKRKRGADAHDSSPAKKLTGQEAIVAQEFARVTKVLATAANYAMNQSNAAGAAARRAATHTAKKQEWEEREEQKRLDSRAVNADHHDGVGRHATALFNAVCELSDVLRKQGQRVDPAFVENWLKNRAERFSRESTIPLLRPEYVPRPFFDPQEKGRKDANGKDVKMT